MGQEAFFVDPLALAEAYDGFVEVRGREFDKDNRGFRNRSDNLISESVVSLYGEGILDGEVAGRARCRSWPGCAGSRRTSNP